MINWASMTNVERDMAQCIVPKLREYPAPVALRKTCMDCMDELALPLN